MANLTHLRYAVLLEQHRHFGNAAAALGISQPALSRAIRSLEKATGLILFDRDSSGVWPTAAGTRLLERARHLLLEMQDFDQETELLREVEAHVLRLSLGPYPAVLSGHRAVGHLLGEVSGLRCRVRVDRWYAAAEVLLAREADLAIAELSTAIQEDERFVVEPLSVNRGVFCCRSGHPLLNAESPSLDDVLDHPWVGPRLPRRVGSSLGTDERRAGAIDPDTLEFVPSIELELLDQIGPLVARSDGVGLVSLSMIERELEEGSVQPVPLALDWLRLNYGFVRLRRRTLSPSTRRYMEFVREIEAEIAAREARLWQRFCGPVAVRSPEQDPFTARWQRPA